MACLRTGAGLRLVSRLSAPLLHHSFLLAGSVLLDAAVGQRCPSAGLRSTFHSASETKDSFSPPLIWKIPGKSWVRLGPGQMGQKVLTDSPLGKVAFSKMVGDGGRVKLIPEGTRMRGSFVP